MAQGCTVTSVSGQLPPEQKFKCIVLGDHGAGKTCLVHRIVHGKFCGEATYTTTVGADCQVKTLRLSSGQQVSLELWDTAGQERFRSLTFSYFRGAAVALLVYDVTVTGACLKLKEWMKEAKLVLNGRDLSYFVVGTKIDLSTSDDRNLESPARDFSMDGVVKCFLVSSKTGANVDDMLMTVANTLTENKEQNILTQSDTGFATTSLERRPDTVTVKKTCCG
ncbi:hypothetical protein BaRGS_00013581 [Batillaria attramentaria]|uniref:Ras-related protein Rab-18 n=1 Tax=Batillaria attramentaria TaxID=370345 RepID=A0ABD0L7C9_9CAEN